MILIIIVIVRLMLIVILIVIVIIILMLILNNNYPTTHRPMGYRLLIILSTHIRSHCHTQSHRLRL